MGSSLSWQTDTQLHDSVQRQLEWDPEIESENIAVIAQSVGAVLASGQRLFGYRAQETAA